MTTATGETAQRFIESVAAHIAAPLRTDEVVYSTASGIVIGLLLMTLHPEYGQALLRELQGHLGNEARDKAFVDDIPHDAPIEGGN